MIKKHLVSKGILLFAAVALISCSNKSSSNNNVSAKKDSVSSKNTLVNYVLLEEDSTSNKNSLNNSTLLEEDSISNKSSSNNSVSSEKDSITLLLNKIDSLFDKGINYDFNKRPELICKETDNLLKEYINKSFHQEIDTTYLKGSYEFALDTFRIRKTIEFCQMRDCSTLRIMMCSIYNEGAENFLVNKYYKKLLSALKSNDRAILIENQKLWKRSYNSDKQLSQLITSEKYTGGGSMWTNVNYDSKMPRILFLVNCYSSIFY